MGCDIGRLRYKELQSKLNKLLQKRNEGLGKAGADEAKVALDAD